MSAPRRDSNASNASMSSASMDTKSSKASGSRPRATKAPPAPAPAPARTVAHSSSRDTGPGPSGKRTLSESQYNATLRGRKKTDRTSSTAKKEERVASDNDSEQSSGERSQRGGSIAMSSESGELRFRRSPTASRHSGSRDGSPAGSDQQYQGPVPPELRRQGIGCNPLIERETSMETDLFDYFEADIIKVQKPLAQSYARVANIKDWIDKHDFTEADVKDVMKKVDWPQFLPHEKLIAYNFAKSRALMALRELMFRRRVDGHPVDMESNTLRDFAYTPSDKQGIKSLDLDKLPHMSEPGLADDPKLFRTTVVLAMIYHDICIKNDAELQADAEWSLFQMWLRHPGEIDDMKPVVERADELRKLSLSKDNLKMAAYELAQTIHDGLTAYQEHGGGKSPQSVESTIMQTYASDLPIGYMDIWRVDSPSIEAWDFRELSEKPPRFDPTFRADNDWPSEPEEDEEPTFAEQFRRGLALGAVILKWLNVNLRNLGQDSSAHELELIFS